MTDSGDIIHCELCGVPYERGVTVCEGCSHALGTTPDWAGLRAELPSLKLQMYGALLVVVAMVIVNAWAFGGAGYIVLVAPIGWALMSGYRYRLLSERLTRAPGEPRQ
jgi:hypothetical protein